MAQEVSRRPLTAEVRPQPQASPCGICGAQSDTGTDFSSSTSVSPVSVIQPMLHDHSFIHSSITGAVSSHQVTASLNNALTKSSDGCYIANVTPEAT
jgi:hypothetical protein